MINNRNTVIAKNAFVNDIVFSDENAKTVTIATVRLRVSCERWCEGERVRRMSHIQEVKRDKWREAELENLGIS